MNNDGGGWTLILNYLHKVSTDPALSVKTTSLPLLNSTTLGNDESANPTSWGHAGNALLAKFTDIQTFRFFCKSSAHNRQVHFKNSSYEMRTYFKTGIVTSLYGDYTWNQRSAELDGGSAILPAITNTVYTNKGNYAMTDVPFFYNNGTATLYAWSIGGVTTTPKYWSCDDVTTNTASTFHQVWAR